MNISYDNYRFNDIATIFSIFSDVTRLRILTVLLSGAKNVKTICDTLGLKQSTCSHQLKILKQANIIKSERRGQHIFYFINNKYIKKIFDFGYLLTEKL